MRGDTLKGHLDLLILSIAGRGPAHGYAIIEDIRRRSGGALDLQEGTVYPVLHRLERSGLLRSRWRVEEGRRRRLYELTASGRRALAEAREEWVAFTVAMNACVS